MNNIYVGIDPGLTGAICAQEDGKLVLHPLPTLSDGKRRRIDVKALQSILRSYKFARDATIMLESVGGTQNAKSASSMSDSFARIESVLILNNIRYDTISAIKWQKTFWSKPKMAKGKKFDTKAAALKVAMRLWPNQDWRRNEKCKVAHDGFVDAALLSEYCRRVFG